MLSARCNHTQIRQQNVKSCWPTEALFINFEGELGCDLGKIDYNEPNAILCLHSDFPNKNLEL